MEARVNENFEKNRRGGSVSPRLLLLDKIEIAGRSCAVENVMSRKARNRMTKDTVPEGFSVPMALVDLVPVVFFGLSAVRLGSLFHSALFVAGALICLLSGVVKVGWKLIAAVSGKNIWPMFVQMRILMPIGFLALLAALVADRDGLNGEAMLAGLTAFPACLFFLAGALGMVLMTVFAFRMDSSDPGVNWTEQIVNGLAQLCFFIGLLLV